jgi:RNA polymerase sigma-70 factor (ECF subfamily)
VDPLTRLAVDAARGDEVATTAFIRATQIDLIRFLTFLADAEHAEDLAQETYLRALRTIGSYRADAPARTWLFAVARHVATDWLRSRLRRPTVITDTPPDHHGAHDFTEEATLKHLVSQLTVERREAFVLTQLLGLPYDEAAAVLGCPIGTVRSRVHRARTDLVAALTDPDASTATA